MTPSIATRLLIVWVAVLAGCGPKAAPPKEVPRPPAGKLGEACTSGGGLAQGNCASGLICLTSAPGGYCAAIGSTCQGGAGFDSLMTPELCGRSCQSDGDCRSGEGYSCDASWKVCVAAGMAVSKAPACSAPPVTRKAFGRVTQISTSKAGATTNGPSAAFNREGDLITAYNVGLSMTGPTTIGIGKAAVAANDIAMVDQDRAAAFEHDNKIDPYLTQDRAGKLYMTWLGFDGAAAESHMQVLVASSDDGATWSKPVVASDANTDCPGDVAHCLSHPVLAIGPDRPPAKNEVIYVFYSSAASGSLRATHSTDAGATFSPSAAVGPGAFADAEVTQSGRVHVVYVSAAGAQKLGDPASGVYYTQSGDSGATFAAPVRISSENEPVPLYFATPQIVVDAPRRLLYAVYPQGTPDGKWEIVLATSKDGGPTWSRTNVNDDSPCATHMLPSAILDAATGKVHVIWVENRSGQGQVAYSACNTGGDKCGKNEAVSDTPFAAFGFGRNSPRSLGDATDLVVDTKHKLIHAVWAQSIDEGGQVTDRIFTAAAKLR